jgi:hypothetical protein
MLSDRSNDDLSFVGADVRRPRIGNSPRKSETRLASHARHDSVAHPGTIAPRFVVLVSYKENDFLNTPLLLDLEIARPAQDQRHRHLLGREIQHAQTVGFSEFSQHACSKLHVLSRAGVLHRDGKVGKLRRERLQFDRVSSMPFQSAHTLSNHSE